MCKRVVLLGSNSNNSSKAGVFYVNSNNDFSNDNPNIGTHLCLFFVLLYISFATWQNTKQRYVLKEKIDVPNHILKEKGDGLGKAT